MKKLILSVFLMFGILVSSQAFAIDDPGFSTAIKKQSVGASQGDPVRVVKLVRFSNRGPNVSSLVSGDAVVYDQISDDGVSVNTTTTSADGAIAGIVCTTIQTAEGSSVNAYEDRGRRNWGWIVVHGPMTATVGAGGTNEATVGSAFFTSVDAARITSWETSDTDGVAVTGETNAVINNRTRVATTSGGFFMDTVGNTDTTVDVFITLE